MSFAPAGSGSSPIIFALMSFMDANNKKNIKKILQLINYNYLLQKRRA